MGEAMIKTLLKAGYKKEQISVVEKRQDRVMQLVGLYGVNEEGAKGKDVIFLTIKPQDFESAFDALIGVDNALLVSLMAGIKIEKIESSINKTNRTIRVMTNTPIVVAEGMSVISAGNYTTDEDVSWVKGVLLYSGKVLSLDEDLMDSVTSVSGSGPAYFFAFVEALTSTAIQLGLSPADADLIVRQTFKGSATLLDMRNESASNLKREVTSPGGTTEAALSVFDSKGLQEMINNALSAAKERSAQLSRSS